MASLPPQQHPLPRSLAQVELGGGLGRSRPAEVAVEGHGRARTSLLLTIREGRNRQVRRMLHGVGSAVLRLSRAALSRM